MKIEEVRPNKPNFKLIVILAVCLMFLLFIVAYFTLDWDGKRLVPHHSSNHPTSKLEFPMTHDAAA